jgi:phage-related protein (TIGR01555 family)
MRLELIDMARHMMNTIAIDSTDDYDQKNMTLSGIREILEQYQFAICAATGIPATKLFGRSPAGQNATGESDLENYYNMVSAYQKNTLREPLMRLIDIISRCSDYDINLPDKWTVEFCSLWNESEKEKAEVKKLEAEAKAKRADAIKILADAQLLDQMEARATLEKDDDYIIDRSLDNEISTPPME